MGFLFAARGLVRPSSFDLPPEKTCPLISAPYERFSPFGARRRAPPPCLNGSWPRQALFRRYAAPLKPAKANLLRVRRYWLPLSVVDTPRNLPLRIDRDVIQARREIRDITAKFGCTLTEQTTLVAATSEIARNTIIHGKGGNMTVEKIVRDGRHGVRLVFIDEGPGIPDIEAAMRDGYTTGGGLGLGLPGARRLVHEFDIRSEIGQGTRVTLVKWSDPR